MKHQFRMPSVPDSLFELEASMWTGQYTLRKDGIPVERSKEKGKPFLIPDGSGGYIRAYPRRSADFAPALEINGAKIKLVRNLKWHEYLVGGLPVILLFIGGAIGGAVSIVAIMVSYNVFRQEGSTAARYLKVSGIVIGSFVLYLALAVLATMMFS